MAEGGVGPARRVSGHRVECYSSYLFFRTYGTGALASYNIQSGRNGGLEAALRAMDQLGVGIGFLMETKLTGRIYTQHSSGYDVLASNVTSSSSGGIALF